MFTNDTETQFLTSINNFDKIGLIYLPEIDENAYFRYILE
jgi:hypothetical protein